MEVAIWILLRLEEDDNNHSVEDKGLAVRWHKSWRCDTAKMRWYVAMIAILDGVSVELDCYGSDGLTFGNGGYLMQSGLDKDVPIRKFELHKNNFIFFFITINNIFSFVNITKASTIGFQA